MALPFLCCVDILELSRRLLRMKIYRCFWRSCEPALLIHLLFFLSRSLLLFLFPICVCVLCVCVVMASLDWQCLNFLEAIYFPPVMLLMFSVRARNIKNSRLLFFWRRKISTFRCKPKLWYNRWRVIIRKKLILRHTKKCVQSLQGIINKQPAAAIITHVE